MNLLNFELEKQFPKMKIFQQIQKNFAILGIDSKSSVQRIPFNARNVSALFLMGVPIVMECIFLNHVVSTFREYIEFIKIIIAMWTGTLALAAIIWKMSDLFRFIDSLEAAIKKSK